MYLNLDSTLRSVIGTRLQFFINLLGWLNPRSKYVYVEWGWDAKASLGYCRGSCPKVWEVGIPEQIYCVTLSLSPLGEWLWALGGSGRNSLHQGFEKYFGGDFLASLKISRGYILYRPGMTVASISISSVQQRRWNPREAKAKWWHLITRDKVGMISVISNRTKCSWSHKQSSLVLVKDHGHHRGGERDGHSATYLICINREVLDQVSKCLEWAQKSHSPSTHCHTWARPGPQTQTLNILLLHKPTQSLMHKTTSFILLISLRFAQGSVRTTDLYSTWYYLGQLKGWGLVSSENSSRCLIL